jgi:tetratricopeptide (TPR) repeat protein
VALFAFLAAPLAYLLLARTGSPKGGSAAPLPPAAGPEAAPEASSLDRAKSLAAAHPGHDAFLDLGLQYYRNREFHESIFATERALVFDPNSAAAYNNICSAYAELRMWDKAIEAGRKALSLKPDFELARNNLAWALREKASALAAAAPGTR